LPFKISVWHFPLAFGLLGTPLQPHPPLLVRAAFSCFTGGFPRFFGTALSLQHAWSAGLLAAGLAQPVRPHRAAPCGPDRQVPAVQEPGGLGGGGSLVLNPRQQDSGSSSISSSSLFSLFCLEKGENLFYNRI
jgi:hypothetical protein